ncbi:MAG: site-specific integrase [Oscillospiraceae bacterium]|nr:site-specific integrase [Oscillospiraceae bacterium]
MANNKITGSIQPKNNVFYAVLNIKDENGRRKPKWISTGLPVKGNKTKAKEVLNQLIKEYSEKIQKEQASEALGSGIDFMEYLRSWLHKKRSSLQDTTIASYQMIIEGKINRYFTPLGLTLQEVTADHVEEFFEHLYEGGITPNTVLHYYAVLQTAFRAATRKRKNRIMAYNPMDDVDRPGGDSYQASFYSSQEVLELLEAAKDDPLYIVIAITAYYGLRRSEVLGIKWNAIDFENDAITIRHKVYGLKDENNQAILKGSDKMKTKASLRSFPLIPYVREALLAEKEKQDEYQRLFKSSYNKTYAEYVCVWPDGKLISPDYVSRHFPVLLRKKGLRSIRFHDLRHTCASLLLAAGIPMKMIQEWLGHSVFQTTANLYSHLEQRAKENAATAIAEKLSVGIIDNTQSLGAALV